MAHQSVPPSIEALARNACQGAIEPLRDLLLRRGGLPGPRPNMKLATDAAHALAAQKDHGSQLIRRWATMNAADAPAGTSLPILPMVGAIGLGALATRANNHASLHSMLMELHDLADDDRREVRDAVVAALVLCLEQRMEPTLQAVQAWFDGYLHAAAVLVAVSEPSIVQRHRDASVGLGCVQQAFALAVSAPRAHQRSHGYRLLLRTIAESLTRLGGRFSHDVTSWIEAHVGVASEDLLAVLHTALDGLRARGLRQDAAMPAYEALDAAVPEPRDPRWDVGPTRGRGKKARRKGRVT